MRVFSVDHASTGYITPHEVNAEIRDLVAAANALDRDNFGSEQVTADKFAAEALGVIVWEGCSVQQPVEFPDTYNRGDEFPLPNDDGDPWRIEFDCQDGFLHGTLNVGFAVTTAGTAVGSAWVAVRLDGNLVALSPPGEHRCEWDCVECSFATPVGAGTHYLEFFCGFAASTAVPMTVTFQNRIFFGEAAYR